MTESVLASELDRCLEGRSDLAILSLDCFDTLIWRDTHAPRDVFRAFGKPTAQQRGWAEQRARTSARLETGTNEVTLPQIYRALLPDADRAALEELIAAELAAEARHCFAFAPIVRLMRLAKADALKVIIVSDTYLDRAELSALIAAAAGSDVLALIDGIYCSSQYGLSKAEGLFNHVLRETGVRPDRILHIGDNEISDFRAAGEAGLQRLHLKQFTEETEQRLRLEAAVGTMVHARGNTYDLAYQPHRATLSMGELADAEPASALGYGVIGPVMTAFTDWVAQEVESISAQGTGQVHTLFLLRDGYLPRLVYEAGATERASTHGVEISRFTATAASFTDRESVIVFLEDQIGADRGVMLNQLLFAPNEIRRLLADLPADHRGVVARLSRTGTMDTILRRSAEFADRLLAYIRKTVNPTKGDRLVLVDLGYNGSVQNLIDGLLSRAFGVKVTGLYLLLREQELRALDKRGFIDCRNYDGDTLEALCGNVAVLEQLCSVAQGSVIDYDAAADPVRAAAGIKGRQSEQRDLVQAGCVAFANDRGAAAVRSSNPLMEESRRRGAVAVLARLMFLPLPRELEALASFDHDINLGSDAKVPLFDPAIAEKGLRQQGMFYMKASERMYLPAEVRGHGLSSSLTLLALRRFGLDLRYSDFCDRSVTLPILVADGREVSNSHVTAMPTHDGYLLAAIPIGLGRFSIGLQFGRLYEWLQIDSIRFVPVHALFSDFSAPGFAETIAHPTLEGLEECGPKLFRCEGDGSFVLVPAPGGPITQPMALAVVFRPIAPRLIAQPDSNVPAVLEHAGAAG